MFSEILFLKINPLNKQNMNEPIKIDFVSDISCGWCAVGLKALEQALHNIAPDVKIDLNFQPFELNPNMPAGGENLEEHMMHKYGEHAAGQYITGTYEQGAKVGFDFRLDSNSRIYNTFDAHRLLHWAGLKGRQPDLSHALFSAHFTENQDPGNYQILLKCVETVKLDVVEAEHILRSGAYATEVKEKELSWMRKGIHAVPTIIINDRYSITGSRSVSTFEELIRSVLSTEQNINEEV
jgi:predicted DsbA family dithiol-disulfide isomerase